MTRSIEARKIVRSFGCVDTELTNRGGLFGTEPSAVAQAFAFVEGSEMSSFNEIARSAVMDGIACSLQGDLPADLYLSVGTEAFAQHLAGRLAPAAPSNRRPTSARGFTLANTNG